MKNRVTILATLALLGWSLGVALLFREYGQSDSGAAPLSGMHEEPVEPEHDHATDEGPPVIKLADLVDFDSATVSRIEPHFHVLNAALVTLVELHQRFLSTPDPDRRRYASISSVTFHQTADKHEQMIEALLTPELRARFHQYMLQREAEVGLHPDPAWHVHGSRDSKDPVPLFRHPETRKSDTLTTSREDTSTSMTSSPSGQDGANRFRNRSPGQIRIGGRHLL